MRSYPKVKSINASWLESIPEHWKWKRIKSVFAERKERNNPVITTNILSLTANQGVVPYSERESPGGNKPKSDLTEYNVARENDLLVNCMNIVSGSAGVSRYTGAISPVYYALYSRENDNIWYFHYLFRLISFQRSLIGLGKGILMRESDNGKLNTVRMRTSMDYLGNVSIPVPPRPEQDQIVRYLDWQVSRIDRLIEGKKREIELLREQKFAFVSKVITRGLKPNVTLRDSGVNWLPRIPAHWQTIKLRDALTSFSLKGHPERQLLSVVREQGVIVRDVEDASTNRNVIPEDLSGYKVVKKNQFVVNKMKAWQGSYGISEHEGIVSPAYFVFDIRFPNLRFFHYAIRSKVYVNFFAQASDGIRVGQWDLSIDKMKSIPFFVPPEKEQQEIVDYIPRLQESLDFLIMRLQEGIERLEEFKTKLISDVITGKFDVSAVNVER